MTRFSILIVISLTGLLAACDVANSVVEKSSRDVAKGVVNSVVQTRFPGVNPAPYTDCIIDNTTSQEILQLASGILAGSDQEAASVVLDIAQRPDTATCIAGASLTSVLG